VDDGEKVYSYLLWVEHPVTENPVYMKAFATLEGAKMAGAIYGDQHEVWSNDGSSYWYLGGKTWIEKAELH